MNGKVQHGTTQSDSDIENILPPKLDTSSLLAEVLKNGLEITTSEQTDATSGDSDVAEVATGGESEVSISHPDEANGTQQLSPNLHSSTMNAFQDRPVISDQIAIADVSSSDPAAQSEEDCHTPSNANNGHSAVLTAEDSHVMEEETAELTVIDTEEAAASALNPPMSPTKKKSFWSKLAIIFKPWKWKRKKRSKKLEQKAVGMCYSVTV